MLSVIFSIYHLGWSNIFSSLESVVDNSDIIYNPVKSKGGFYIAWQVVLGFVSAVIWPTAITRALSLNSPNAVKTVFMVLYFILIRFMIPCFLGICAFIYFNSEISNSLIMMPEYLVEILPVGVLGITVAAMLAAFMSTHDSYLLCWSTIITNDIIDPLTGANLNSTKKINYSRIIIIILGIYILYWV